MRDVFPLKNEAFIAWLETFLTVAATLLEDLGWEPTFLADWVAKLAELKAKNAAADLAKAASKSAVEDRDDFMQEIQKELRPVIGEIQLNNKMTDTKKKSIGVKVHDTTPSHEVPFIPAVEKLTGLAEGVIIIDIDPNGNKRGTQYIIECRFKDETDYRRVDTITSLRYHHGDQTPGKTIYYRVTARRGKLYSAPSLEVGIYTED